MKIALLTGTFSAFSGIDRVVYAQAKQLQSDGHSVMVVAFKADMDCPGVTVRTIGMPRNRLLQRFYRLFFFLDRRTIRRWAEHLRDYTTVCAHQYPMTLIAERAQRQYGVEYIYYNHGIAPPQTFMTIIEKVYIWLFIRIARRSIRRAGRAISISQYLADTLKSEVGLVSKVRYNRIDSGRFHPGLDGEGIRKELGVGHEPVLLYVGRLSPHKGIHLLIKAFRRLADSMPTAHLVIVGEETFPRYTGQLRKTAPKSVLFTGFVSEAALPLYYAACDVYVTASLWEGYDLPFSEAHACGKPVVAFNCGSHPELAQRGDRLVPIGDTNAFTQAIIEVLSC